MKLQETCSGGGPVIAVPAELASLWRGTSPPVGVEVPEGWRWGSGDIVCDYDRACDEVEDVIRTEYGGVGWLKVGDGVALIFDMELMTVFLPQENGGVILRNYPPEAVESETAQTLFDAVPEDFWQTLPKTLRLSDGRLFIFDSAYEGAAEPNDIDADDGVAVGEMKAGEYKVSVAVHDEIDFIRLIRASS